MDTTLSDPVTGLTLDGRYLVESRIARGGMATVYLGHDIRLDRRVALKVMHPSLAADEEFIHRFISEATSVARLSHPNVVAVYDQGSDSGHVFLAMEYVPGQTLRDLLRHRVALHPREALQILGPVLSGLSAAHHAGLMHRDVKPENVLLTNDRRIKVADFGLARAVATTSHTKTGMIIGTVGYLSPEQVTRGIADARSDVYAAGVMLFEMLTGRQPHQADTPLAVAYKHVNEPVPNPSRLVPGLSPSVDALVAMATSRDPDLRPSDAGQFLHAVLDTLPTLPADSQNAVVVPAPDTRDDMLGTEAVNRQNNHTLIVPRDSTEAVPLAGDWPDDSGRADESFRQRRWMTSRPLTVLSITLAVVVAIAAAGWWLMIGRWSNAPRLVGMSVAQARARATHAGFHVRVGPGRFNRKVHKGVVVATSPGPGGRILRGHTITVYPSKGPRIGTVPDVTGTSLGAARQKLSNAGFTAGKVTHQFNTQVGKGDVVVTSPTAKSRHRLGTSIALVVSSGIRLPDLVGQNVNTANQQLTRLGLKMQRTDKHSDKPANEVLGQHPRGGVGVSRGDTVDVVVSKGPKKVQVPDLSGKNVPQARRALSKLGFKVKVQRIFNGNRVFNTQPGAGDQAPKGTTVTIWAGP